MGVKQHKASRIDLLLQELDFSPEHVIEASVKQARLFSLVAEHRASCAGRRYSAKAKYELVRAEKALAIRRRAAKRGERVSEGYIAERAQVDPAVQAAQTAMAEAEKAEEYAKLLVDAFRMRRDSIRVVADMVAYNLGAAAGSGGEAKAGLNRMRRRLASQYPGEDEG